MVAVNVHRKDLLRVPTDLGHWGLGSRGFRARGFRAQGLEVRGSIEGTSPPNVCALVNSFCNVVGPVVGSSS